ncbi:MAG TPA: hypothetical protein VE967_18280, partial [Gemmatimonadaceae bacterium]|nr:hypothetical protein [Gemmatimonadaceae bacterium]
SMRISSTQLPGGGISLSPVINPLATLDDWAVLPDGTIAILRGLDYHVDWIAPDGSRTSSGKMPFDWKRLTDEEKAAIVDSTKAQLDRQANGGAIVNPLASVPGHDATGAPSGHSMTIMPVTTSDGGPPPKMEAPPKAGVPEVVSPKDLPDYMPPVLRSGTMKVDGRGNIWVLPSTSTQSAGGLLYDVINRAGQIVERVRLPAGRALEGFGSNGTIYLSVHSAEGTRLERY